jgi:hypothetical protein
MYVTFSFYACFLYLEPDETVSFSIGTSPSSVPPRFSLSTTPCRSSSSSIRLFWVRPLFFTHYSIFLSLTVHYQASPSIPNTPTSHGQVNPETKTASDQTSSFLSSPTGACLSPGTMAFCWKMRVSHSVGCSSSILRVP